MKTVKKGEFHDMNKWIVMKEIWDQKMFSLIELLVVITIISILAGLLLPTLGKARESSRSILCISNERELIRGYSFYADDFDGWIRPVSLDGTIMTSWTTCVAKEYCGKKSDIQIGKDDKKYPLFTCPSENTKVGSTGFFIYGHYAVNAPAVGDSFNNDAHYKPRKLSSLLSPSKVLMLLDSVYKQGHSIATLGSNGIDLGFRHGNSGGVGIEEDNTYKRYLFGQKINTAFYDGHGKSLNRKDWEYNGYGIQRYLLLTGYANNYSVWSY